MKSSPVKIENSRTVIVRNLSKIPAVYGTDITKPFTVKPTEGVLNADESVVLTIKFKTYKVGTYNGCLKILYQTGEKLVIQLEATAENENIYLETNQIEFDDTFMSLSTNRTVKLFNKSDHVLNYQWKLYPHMEDDERQWKQWTDSFYDLKDYESKIYANLEFNEILSSEEHGEICERIFEDEIQEHDINKQLFLYKNTFFQIIPKVSTWLDTGN